LSGHVTDPDTGTVVTTWTAAAGPDVDPGATCTFADPSSLTTTVTCTDDGTFTLTLTGDDGINAPVTATAPLAVTNAPPVATISSPADNTTVEAGKAIDFTATVNNPDQASVGQPEPGVAAAARLAGRRGAQPGSPVGGARRWRGRFRRRVPGRQHGDTVRGGH